MSHLPKNDISHLLKIPGSERIQAAVRIRGKMEDIQAEMAPLMQAQRPIPPTPLKFADWDKLDFDPDRRLTPHQVRLHEYLILCGRAGLARGAYLFCKEHFHKVQEPLDTDRHRHILNDFEKNGSKRVQFTLMTMHTDILHAMIDGNMSSRYYEDDQFRVVIDQYAKPNEALPMIYLNQLARVEYIDSKKQPWAGRFLSRREWVDFLAKLGQYESESKQKKRTEWVLKVDGSHPTNEPLKDGATCRFLTNDRRRAGLSEFIAECRKRFVKQAEKLAASDPQDPRLDVPYAYSPSEIGFALKGQQRVSDHTSYKQSNWLLSLVFSTAWALFGKDKFEMRQYKILELGDPLDAQIGECMCSEIGPSYWYNGGMNPELGGTIAMEAKVPRKGKAITLAKNDPLWQASKKDILSRPYGYANVTEEKEKAERVCRVIRETNIESREETWDKSEVGREELKKEMVSSLDRVEATIIYTFRECIEALRDEEREKMSL